MTTLVRWNPVRDAMALHKAMDRFFEAPVSRRSWNGPVNRHFTNVAIDLYETDNSIVVEATLPGFSPEQVDLSIEDGILTLKSEVKHDSEDRNDGEDVGENGSSPKYYVRERFYGSFERRVRLPNDVDAEAAAASFENGLLIVTLPKAEAVKRRQIPVNVS